LEYPKPQTKKEIRAGFIARIDRWLMQFPDDELFDSGFAGAWYRDKKERCTTFQIHVHSNFGNEGYAENVANSLQTLNNMVEMRNEDTLAGTDSFTEVKGPVPVLNIKTFKEKE
jgi:hypothetical protein